MDVILWVLRQRRIWIHLGMRLSIMFLAKELG